MDYDEVQADAIRKAAVSKVMVLTGGPGTGKTTTTQGIIAAYRAFGLKILLAAPTGRAAKRMTEATGLEAKTIHRLLECQPPEGYLKNEENPLEGDVLIVDECSMIDIVLMNALLKAIPQGMRLILVGDIDQLPSVGAGNVLRDIIDSETVPVIRLTRIFRQAQSSRIIMNAHRINEGKMPDISNGKDTDFFFVQKEDPQEAADEVMRLVKNKLSRYYQTPPSQIQVLTPMQKGIVGAANLNTILQETLNPQGEGLRRGGFVFRVNDKVMQIRNNYDKEVFNGDIGMIDAVDVAARNLKVNFDGRIVEYDVTELDELTLAYATTIHKAQGIGISDRRDAGADESFCDASEKSDLYRNHPCEKNPRTGRNTQGTFLCRAECDGDKTKYSFKRKVTGKVLKRRRKCLVQGILLRGKMKNAENFDSR